MPFRRKEMVGERFGSMVITRRLEGGDVVYLCDCGRERVVSRNLLIGGGMKKCECVNAVKGAFDVPLGAWRNARKFKCIKCLKWQPLYYESRNTEGVCEACG